jgi:microcompartment protein CcmL/EutN
MNRNDKNPQLEKTDIGPAIALLELCSVARGVEVADAILWEAEIEMLFSTTVQPGKYIMLFTGSVEALRSALRRGKETAQEDLVADLLIPNVHPQIEVALRREGNNNGTLDALGIVETRTVAAAVRSADAALKRSTVDLIELRIANGLGGKSYYTITGEVSDVRSAIVAGAQVAEDDGQLARQVVIPRPHVDLVRHL